MSLGWRFLIIEDDDGIRRVPQRHVDHLITGKFPLPEYAGSVLRTAFVMLELRDRRPAQVTHLEGAKRHFDEQGYIKQRSARDLALWHEDAGKRQFGTAGNVICITETLIKKRQDHLYRWDPTPADVTRMIDFIWSQSKIGTN